MLLLFLALLLVLPGLAEAQNQLELTFTDRSPDEDGFRIERSVGSMNTGFTEITTLGASTGTAPGHPTGTGMTVTFLDTDAALVAGTLYCYRVRAFNAGGNSGYSNARCGVAGPKESLRIRVIPGP